jgi:23S rRNA (uracil1939-C5)-methyltransferase
MLLLQARIESEGDRAQFEKVLQYVADGFPEVTSLLYVVNNKCNDTFGDLEVVTYKGTDVIYEEM